MIGNGEMIEAYATGYPIRASTYGQASSPPATRSWSVSPGWCRFSS